MPACLKKEDSNDILTYVQELERYFVSQAFCLFHSAKMISTSSVIF